MKTETQIEAPPREDLAMRESAEKALDDVLRGIPLLTAHKPKRKPHRRKIR